VTFSDIHVDPKTVRTLRTLTSLALVNPMAFSYGILSKEKVLGVMLHGPPGTGKSLLAKAVAKESVACMLEVSGADFRSKWIGEDEKLVRAVFSLARKLDPCVIFIDEADAVFRKRSADDSEYRRDMLSQFLQEWDGVSSSSKGGFVMVATNRPEDLDAAVLRRLPRRIYVGLPSDEDREAILRIHLKEEKLGDDVDLEDIARQASEFTGSDLKNLCVVAAMASVYEAHSEMLEGFGGQPWKKGRRRRARLPAGRVIYARHFQQALSEIGAAMEAPGISKIREFGRLYKEKI
jgi:SpoVK/Ycf46/Vps4 family AAA+-type ATPase